MDPLADRRSTASSMGCYYSTVSSSYASFRTSVVDRYPPDGQGTTSSLPLSYQRPPPPPPPPPPPQKKKKKNIPPNIPYLPHPLDLDFESSNNYYGASKSFASSWQNPERLAEFVSESTDSERFARLVLAIMVTLIISLSMASLVLWVLFGVDLPIFEVGTLSVSKFTVTDSVIKATWKVNLTVTNPNSEFQLSDDLLNATILYKDHPLAMASVLPVYRRVDTNEDDGRNELQQASLFLEFDHSAMMSSSSSSSSVHAPQYILDEVFRSLEVTGVLPVSLSVVVRSKFVSHDENNNRGWSQDTLKIFCGDLKILIPSHKGDGHLAEQSSGKECLTFA